MTGIGEMLAHSDLGRGRFFWRTRASRSTTHPEPVSLYEQFNMDSREETAFRLAEIVEFGDIRIGEWHDPTTLFHFEP